MGRTTIALLLLLAEICYCGDDRHRLPSPVLDSLLRVGIDLTLRQHYESAMNVFRNVTREFPDHPAGYVYQMGVLQSIAMDYEEIIEDGEFDSLLSIAKTKSQVLIDRDPGSPWGHYFLGTALGHDSYARAQRGDWFGTITKGLSAVSKLEDAVERDSLFYDPYLGIGTYSYWKTRKMEFLVWLPFVSDDRAKGIEFLKQCARGGEYNKYAAMGALVSIYLDAGKNSEADSVSSTALREYPQNRILLWGKATALERSGSANDAIVIYRKLLEAITRDTRGNFYNELVCRLKLAELSFKTNRFDDAVQHVKDLMDLEREKFPERLRDRAKDKFDRARELAKTISAHKNNRN